MALVGSFAGGEHAPARGLRPVEEGEKGGAGDAAGFTRPEEGECGPRYDSG
jgi:hypothetical protein